MRAPIVTAARKYLGVPFGHRGRSRRRLDCAGLVCVSYADLGVLLQDEKHYGQEPLDNSLPNFATRELGEPVQGPVQVGDIVLIRYEGRPHHVAIIGDHFIPGVLTLIHADSLAKKVVEHRLTDEQITHIFRRPV